MVFTYTQSTKNVKLYVTLIIDEMYRYEEYLNRKISFENKLSRMAMQGLLFNHI